MLLKNPLTPPPELPEPDEFDELALVAELLAGAPATLEPGEEFAFADFGVAIEPRVAVSQPLMPASGLDDPGAATVSVFVAASVATTTDSGAAGASLMPASR